jgi:hypothetical protein
MSFDEVETEFKNNSRTYSLSQRPTNEDVAATSLYSMGVFPAVPIEDAG